jgi:hypothetical protein
MEHIQTIWNILHSITKHFFRKKARDPLELLFLPADERAEDRAENRSEKMADREGVEHELEAGDESEV